MRRAEHGATAGSVAVGARPEDVSALEEEDCPADFADRYTAAYRAAYRLLGEPEEAVRIARAALAAADAAALPRSERVRTVRACRAAAMAALRETKDEPPGPDDERARLRAALRELPAQPRTVFLLVRVAGLPASDVGAVLGLTPDWCASQLRAGDREVCDVLGVTVDGPPPDPRDSPGPGKPEGPSRGRREMLLAARGER